MKHPNQPSTNSAEPIRSPFASKIAKPDNSTRRRPAQNKNSPARPLSHAPTCARPSRQNCKGTSWQHCQRETRSAARRSTKDFVPSQAAARVGTTDGPIPNKSRLLAQALGLRQICRASASPPGRTNAWPAATSSMTSFFAKAVLSEALRHGSRCIRRSCSTATGHGTRAISAQ